MTRASESLRPRTRLGAAAVAAPVAAAAAAATRAAALRRVAGAAAPLAVPAVALAVWALSLHRIDPDTIGATGLVSVLPATALVPLGALTVSFCVNLRRRRAPGWVLGAHVL